jgi:hypothetical protein
MARAHGVSHIWMIMHSGEDLLLLEQQGELSFALCKVEEPETSFVGRIQVVVRRGTT